MTRIIATIVAGGLLLSGSQASASLPEKDEGQEATQTSKRDQMFRDEVTHDFGKVWSGTKAKCAFRIVNPTDVTLRVVSLRRGG